MKAKTLFQFSVLSLCMASAMASPYKWQSFEEQPTNLIVQNGDAILSPARYKDGMQALHWQFQPNGKLVFEQVLDLSQDESVLPQTFMLWLYNEKAITQPLDFQFEQSGQIKKSFQISLNFTGWRGIAVPFRDMKGEKADQLDKLVINAPSQAGSLYLDQLMFNIPVDNRNPIPDYTAPFVNLSVNTAVNKHWNALLMYDNLFKEKYPTLNFKGDLAKDKQSDSIYQRFEYHLGVTPSAKLENFDFAKLLEKYQAFQIEEKEGIIRAPILDFPARQKFMKNDAVFSKEEQAFLLRSVSMRDLGKVMLETAKALRTQKLAKDQQAELEQRFLLATRYLFDQGFVRGSGMQMTTHLGYQSREIFDAWFLMRELLAKHHLLEQAQGAMMWFNGGGRIFEPKDTIVSANVDILNTQLQWMLKSILLLPDQKQRSAILAQFSDWLSNYVLQSQGIAGGFKVDGSVFHHGQHYVAYGKDAFGGLSPVVYALSESDFRLRSDARRRLDDVLYKMWVYTKEGNIPIVLSGRHPTGLFQLSPAPFKWFALAGSPGNPKEIDRTFAGIFAALDHKADYEGVAAAAEPTGAWTMNYASMVVQRRYANEPNKSWLAIARGFSRYLVGNEAYEKNNRYGRYLQYGTLELIPSKFEERGYRYEGWDWNRFPGTTAINLPYPQLKAQLAQLPAAGVEEMLLSTESYAGGTDLDSNSMYAMKLHGHSKYQQEGLRARKSYFLFDNQIVALGSGIQSDDPEHSTETTIFQHAVPELQPITLDGGSLNQLGTILGRETPLHLTDPAGNHYYLAQGDKVKVSYATQKSLDDRTDKPTEGNFATVVIDHGKAPKSAKYEYAIVIEPKGDTKPNYTKLMHDDRLHAVRDNRSQQESYAYFEADNRDVGGVITAVDNPVMVMASPKSNQLSLSVVNPDLAFYQGVEADQVQDGKQREVSVYSRQWRENPSQPQQSRLTLKGAWQLKEKSDCAKVETGKQTTQVITKTVNATPCKLVLSAR